MSTGQGYVRIVPTLMNQDQTKRFLFGIAIQIFLSLQHSNANSSYVFCWMFCSCRWIT